MLALIRIAHRRVTIGEAGISDELHQLGSVEQCGVEADPTLEPVVDVVFALADVDSENEFATGSQHPAHFAQGRGYFGALHMNQRVKARQGDARVVGKRHYPHVAEFESQGRVPFARVLQHHGRDVDADHVTTAASEVSPDMARPATEVADEPARAQHVTGQIVEQLAVERLVVKFVRKHRGVVTRDRVVCRWKVRPVSGNHEPEATGRCIPRATGCSW